MSPASITDPDWWSTLGALLRANSGVAERLIVEITESMAIHDVDDTRGFVSRVKDLGCRIAIDDFGSGFTSFRNLRKLGVDVLKIDGAFVQNLTRSNDDRSFVHSLVDLARRLGLKTVAEWVQDEDSAKLLAEWGCDYLQGALVGLATVERPWGETVQVDRRKTTRTSPDHRVSDISPGLRAASWTRINPPPARRKGALSILSARRAALAHVQRMMETVRMKNETCPESAPLVEAPPGAARPRSRPSAPA